MACQVGNNICIFFPFGAVQSCQFSIVFRTYPKSLVVEAGTIRELIPRQGEMVITDAQQHRHLPTRILQRCTRPSRCTRGEKASSLLTGQLQRY